MRVSIVNSEHLPCLEFGMYVHVAAKVNKG